MFELAYPWVLVFLGLPFLWHFFLPKARVHLNGALTVPFFHALQPQPQQRLKKELGLHNFWLPFLIWSLLIFALAGPRYVGEPQPVLRDGYNIMLALDLSGSMQIPDMQKQGRAVSRLSVVKQAAEDFVRQREGDKIGLILFGTKAYLQTPLTYDRHSVLLRLEDASVGLAGQTTSIGDTVGLAIKRLSKVPQKGRVLILLTDGANNSGILDPLKAAAMAKEEGIKIYTIGLGADEQQRQINAFLTQHMTADLDEDSLREMAKITGGRYFRATDSQSLMAIYQTINQLETLSQEQEGLRPQKEYYPWFVLAAFLLCFLWLMNQTSLLSFRKGT